MKNAHVLELKNIRKSFGEKIVLKDISFNIVKGDLVAIIGPSGSGKSTLMNIITKSTSYDKGEILIEGIPSINISNSKDYAKKIGIIKQQFDLVRELSVVQNVLAGRLNEWGFIKSFMSLVKPLEEEKALKALEAVGIKEKAYNITSQLSGGEQQRVAIARLLIQDPEIFLADEPISSLDPARANDVLSLITNLSKEKNKTLIASMHSVEYVMKYFNRAIGIKNGEVLFNQPVKELSNETLEKLYELEEVENGA